MKSIYDHGHLSMQFDLEWQSDSAFQIVYDSQEKKEEEEEETISIVYKNASLFKTI